MRDGNGMMTRGAIGISEKDPYGERDLGREALVGMAKASRPATTFTALIAQANETTSYARDRLESLEALSSRAFNLAQRLTGSFSGSGATPGPSATDEKERPPAAALEGLGQCIGEIRRPLAAMNTSFDRLVAALNAIEEALS